MTCRVLTYDTREDWLVARRNYIGSSDAGVLWGECYSSQSLYALWASKALGIEVEWGKADSLRLRRGVALEPLIRQLAAEELGVELFTDPPHSFRVNSKYEHLAASLDSCYSREFETVPVELKHVGKHNEHDWDNGQCPLIYQCQIGHQMLVCDSPFGYVVGLCEDELLVRRIERDAGWEGGHKELCRRFWEYVESRTSPPIDASSATTDAIKARWRRETGPRVEVGEWVDDVTKELAELDETLKATQAAVDERKNRLRDAIGDAEGCISPSGVEWTWKLQERKEYVVAASSARILRRVGGRKKGNA